MDSHRSQKAAANTMGLALQQVERESGCQGIVVLSFPDPLVGGNVKVIR